MSEEGPPTALELFAVRLNRGHQERHAGDAPVDSGPENPYADLESRLAAEGLSLPALFDFKFAARALKQAETAFRDAQQAYAETVKRLSEEAVK